MSEQIVAKYLEQVSASLVADGEIPAAAEVAEALLPNIRQAIQQNPGKTIAFTLYDAFEFSGANPEEFDAESSGVLAEMLTGELDGFTVLLNPHADNGEAEWPFPSSAEKAAVSLEPVPVDMYHFENVGFLVVPTADAVTL